MVFGANEEALTGDEVLTHVRPFKTTIRLSKIGDPFISAAKHIGRSVAPSSRSQLSKGMVFGKSPAAFN